MLQINGKTFMNLQEAVQWLLDNNALPFQSSANYVANTEIGMGTIVNPSPAKVRIGSLIFFADSKVSTVTGLTENGFIVSDQYNDLVDDIVYVSNVALNASGHLIVTLSNGEDIDAGLIKQVTGFSINGSQHLIVSYNDGTTTDLGAIFNGNITISGNLTVTGNASIANLSATNANIFETIKDSGGHARFIEGEVILSSISGFTKTFGRWSLSGSHLMIVLCGTVDNGTTVGWTEVFAKLSGLPSWIFNKIYTITGTYVAKNTFDAWNSDLTTQTMPTDLRKGDSDIYITLESFTASKDRIFRIAYDLLIDNA